MLALAPLLSGYAVVSRDGKFGLLDSTGAELVPCAYDGLAWDGGTAWVKLADGWHEYTIPGVTKPDPLADLPDSVTAPDTYPRANGRGIFMADANSTNRLNLRAGPGLAYDIPRQNFFPPPCACTGIPPPPPAGHWCGMTRCTMCRSLAGSVRRI